MPMTTEEFLQNFVTYNEGIQPIQVLLVIMAVIAVGLVFVKTKHGDRITGWILGLLWLWTGLVYHINYFSAINPAAYLFGAVVTLEGVALLWAVGVKGNLSFNRRNTPSAWIGFAFVAYALLIYPLLGYTVGHVYPQQPTFGAPCPTTIFTFGMLLPARGRA
ncbi:hypothetical protein GF324_00080, partial [bacterium]|nr:hypothetical protein [bacterium]